MSQKPNFPKTAVRRSKPRKRVNFLTVSANCNFVSSHSRTRRPPTLKSIGIEGVSPDLTGICPRRAGWWCGGQCVRPGCRLGVVAHGCEGCRLVGDCVAVVVRPDAVRFVVAHGVKLLRSWRVCPSPRLEAVGACWSVCKPCTLYIYNRQKQIILMQKQKNLCFYLVI